MQNQTMTRKTFIAQTVLLLTEVALIENLYKYSVNQVADIMIRIANENGIIRYDLTDGNETFHTYSFKTATSALAYALQ